VLNEYHLMKGNKLIKKQNENQKSQEEEKQVSLNKNEEKPEKYYYELEKKFKNKIMTLKSCGMEKRVCLDLLEKHNGNLQKVLNEYHLMKEKKDCWKKKVEEKKVNNEKELFQGRLIILKSYGFDEKVSKELLIKHNGNLFRVLNEYYVLFKPKDFNITKNLELKGFEEKVTEIDDLLTEEKVTEGNVEINDSTAE